MDKKEHNKRSKAFVVAKPKKLTRLQAFAIVIIIIALVSISLNSAITYSNETRPSSALFENSQTVEVVKL